MTKISVITQRIIYPEILPLHINILPKINLMKTFLSILVFCIFSIYCFAQDTTKTHSPFDIIHHSIGITIGFNNPSAIGYDYEKFINPKFSLSTGIGYGSWQMKIPLYAKYYFKTYKHGWTLASGFTYCRGGDKIPFVNEVKPLRHHNYTYVDLSPMVNYFAGVYHYRRIGRRNHRSYFMAGYSLQLTPVKYKLDPGYTILDKTKTNILYSAPGGFMLGTGLAFGDHKWKKQYRSSSSTR